jgi:hypothetical protein
MRLKSALLFLSAVLAFNANLAHANLIKNGGFEANIINKSQIVNGKQFETNGITIKDWTSSKNGGNSGGYNFLMNSSNAHLDGGAMQLQGSGKDFFKSPSGGNFFASDPDYGPGTLKQLVEGLTIGSKYLLTFEFALAQQANWSGANNDVFWQVGFGGKTQDGKKLSIPEKGFSGWETASMVFTATSTSEWLSFLSQRTASGGPPFMLLDNVQLRADVPEPATWALMLAGLGMLGYFARRRRQGQA